MDAGGRRSTRPGANGQDVREAEGSPAQGTITKDKDYYHYRPAMPTLRSGKPIALHDSRIHRLVALLKRRDSATIVFSA